MSVATFAALVVFATVMVVTPGPANMLLMAAGARSGLRRSLPFVLGVTAGKLSVTGGVGAGLYALLQAVPGLALLLKVLASGYIAWLAWRIARMRLAAGPDSAPAPGFGAGLLVHPLNPKAWAMVTSAYAQFTEPTQPWLPQVAIVMATFFAIQLVSHTLWCGAGGGIARALAGTRWERVLLLALAALTVASVGWAWLA